MWHEWRISGDLVGGKVEQKENIPNDHGGRSLWLGAWLQDRCHRGQA